MVFSSGRVRRWFISTPNPAMRTGPTRRLLTIDRSAVVVGLAGGLHDPELQRRRRLQATLRDVDPEDAVLEDDHGPRRADGEVLQPAALQGPQHVRVGWHRNPRSHTLRTASRGLSGR